MAETTTETQTTEVSVQDAMLPSAEITRREQRDTSLKRFNALFVYAPIVLMLVLLIALMIVVGIAAVFDGDVLRQTYSSGFADAILLMACIIPATLFAAILPAGSLFLLYERRKRGSLVRAPLTKGLRKVDTLIVTADDKAGAAQTQVADRIVSLRGRIAYIGTVIVRMQEFAVEKINGLMNRNPNENI